jgi:hypothetical protein
VPTPVPTPVPTTSAVEPYFDRVARARFSHMGRSFRGSPGELFQCNIDKVKPNSTVNLGLLSLLSTNLIVDSVLKKAVSQNRVMTKIYL